jgi:hypothetical protein
MLLAAAGSAQRIARDCSWTGPRARLRSGRDALNVRHSDHEPLIDITTADDERRAMAERTKYQQNIIKNFYQNQDAILTQRLGEQITELYLAEGKARQKQWAKVIATLEKLKIPKTRIDHVHKADNPSLVAKLLEEILAKA